MVMKAWKNAFRGLAKIASGRQFRIGLAFGLVVTVLSYLLSFSVFDKLVVIAFAFLVLVFEGFNSSLEALLNLLHPSYSKEVGIVKDMLAGTVAIATIGAVIVGVLILVRVLELG